MPTAIAPIALLCPGCVYRPQGPEGLCSECLAARAPVAHACVRCGRLERNVAGDCAHCQRKRERARYQPTGRQRGRPRLEGPCVVEGCAASRHSKGLCRRHYLWQWRKDRAA